MSRKLKDQPSPRDVVKLTHELGVFQEEVEIQNQQLLESQRLLEESRDRYAQLYDFAPVAMVTICEEGVLREVNLTATALLGDTRRSLLETPFILFVTPAYRSAFLEHLRRCRSGEAGIQTYLVIKNRSGKQIPIELNSNRSCGCVGERMQFHTALVDVTQRQAREAAEEANRLKDEFLAMVSHELRTPLSAVLLWSHLLHSGAVPEADRKEALETIHQNARTQSRIIDDLLDLARLVSGKVPLDMKALNLAPLVRQSVESLRPQARASGLEMQLQEPGRALMVCGDTIRLRQVVLNLLSNALKFTPRGGQILVRLTRKEQSAELVVRDSGIGITEELLPHVFERFRQGDANITRSHGGLGLGLAIVRQLVQAHGGESACPKRRSERGGDVHGGDPTGTGGPGRATWRQARRRGAAEPAGQARAGGRGRIRDAPGSGAPAGARGRGRAER